MHRYSSSSIERARSAAALAALREHERLNTVLTERIDVFDVIERSGIWLMFQPLKNLFGFYVPAEEGAGVGIIINSKHPPSLQRFTAAHEYGHYVLRHAPSFDDAACIGLDDRVQSESRRQDSTALTRPPFSQIGLAEIEAQTFAANFLMPLQLVNTLLRRMDLPINPSRLTPRQVYRLSLDLGVSYRAVVNHLATLHKIRWDDTDLLRDEAPKDIKIDIGRGVRPEDVRADAWPLEERDAGKVLHPRVNDELHVFLPELPGSGYIWEVVGPTLDRQAERSASRDADDAPFVLVRNTFQTSVPEGGEERLGARGIRCMVFRILRPGRHTLRLIKRRPWERARIPQAAFEVELEVAPRPTGTGDQGLSERQKPLLTLAA